MGINVRINGRVETREINGYGVDRIYFYGDTAPYDLYCENKNIIAYDAGTIVCETEEDALEYGEKCDPVYFCRAGGGEVDFVIYAETQDDDE